MHHDLLAYAHDRSEQVTPYPFEFLPHNFISDKCYNPFWKFPIIKPDPVRWQLVTPDTYRGVGMYPTATKV